MAKCIIDGIEIEFTPGENLVDVAKRGGIEIPVFCYHPGLTVVAQCRMCACEIEKMPKIQTACSTKAADGMVVKTQTENVMKARASVMEFLLVNHPLDCPICDKAGECDLQDFSYQYGNQYMRSTEERRTYLDLDMGPVIKKNMNRCIHCTRCIRFGEEVAGIHEMVALQRGNNTEITTIDGRPLETDYAGNYADICPTGSLTLKDFRFHKRAWMLKKAPSICEGCSRGCNIEVHHDNNVIFRTLPRANPEVNRWWLCDEGRFHFHDLYENDRIESPLLGKDGKTGTWSDAIAFAESVLKGKKVAALIGSDLTQEEMTLAKDLVQRKWAGAPLFHFGTPGVLSSQEDGPADQILKRKSKTANLNGAEKLGLTGFKELPSGIDAVVIFKGGRAVMPDLKGVTQIGVGVFFKSETTRLDCVLPGPAFTEKDGTFFNFEGREQKLKRAVIPPRLCRTLSEVAMMMIHGSATVQRAPAEVTS